MKKIILYSTLTLFFAGCAQNVPTHEDAVASLKSGTSASKTKSAFASPHLHGEVRDDWLKTFKDRKLTRLVKEGEKNNPNLKVAALRRWGSMVSRMPP